DVIGVACEDRTLSVFSACGWRLLPAILLQAPMSTLHCSGCYVMALTACATLSVCAGRQASRLSSTPHLLQQGMTLAYLENQMASALALKSSPEYRHWLLIYARFLVNEGSQYRLRELCKDLLGPVHKSAASVWEATVLPPSLVLLTHRSLKSGRTWGSGDPGPRNLCNERVNHQGAAESCWKDQGSVVWDQDTVLTLNGLGILVCSMDGTVAYLDFSQDELGDPLNEEEKNSIHQKIYGKSLAITTEAQLPTTIIENPEMLKYQQQKQLAEQRNAASREAHTPKLTSVVNGESLEDIRKNLLKKQVETRTADGRRRITPLCIAQLDTGDFSPALFNSVPILPGSSVSSQLTQQLTSSDSNTANSLSLKPCPEPTAAAAPRPADDALHKEGYIGPSTVFGSSSKLANVEQWRCVTILRSHTGDVMDVAWSPHDAWLASCSVDNTIVIWNARKFPEIIATLRGHTGLVKGLTWDPVGKYIASQADDRNLKVWRTMDWQLETSITKPFDECGGTTHVLRLSWSPDGQYLVSAHAMNNSGPTAQIIERDGWKTNMDFVGHRKAVTVVKFNPKIFKKKQKNGSSPKPSCPYCCCAVGSKDRSVSVWVSEVRETGLRSSTDQ
ncbi:Protein HIRA, partial [Acipenser ruthenus]